MVASTKTFWSSYMIQRVFGIASIFFLCVGFHAHAETPIESNRLDARLDGVWILKSMQRGGEKIEGDDIPVRMRGTKRTIKGTKMTLARGGDPRQLKCTITVDTSTKPKQMDVSVEREGKVRVLKCIYEIKDGAIAFRKLELILHRRLLTRFHNSAQRKRDRCAVLAVARLDSHRRTPRHAQSFHGRQAEQRQDVRELAIQPEVGLRLAMLPRVLDLGSANRLPRHADRASSALV